MLSLQNGEWVSIAIPFDRQACAGNMHIPRVARIADTAGHSQSMTLNGSVRCFAYSNEGRMLFNPTGRLELGDFWNMAPVSDGAGGGAAMTGVSKWMMLAKSNKWEMAIAL